MKSRYLRYVILALGFILLFSLVSCNKRDWRKYNHSPHPTRAMYITPGLDCYIGESIETKQYRIRYTASGMYLGEDASMKETDEYKYIFVEYEIKAPNEKGIFEAAGDDIDVTDAFYLILDEAVRGDETIRLIESDAAEGGKAAEQSAVPHTKGNKLDPSASPDVPEPGQNRRRVYFKVPSDLSVVNIYFQDPDAEEDVYHFLYDGLYCDWYDKGR